MKIFLDSANLDEVKEYYDFGIIEGITTNPSLVKLAMDAHKKKSKKKFKLEEYIMEVLSIAKGTPVSLEVTKTDYEGMVSEAMNLYNKFNAVASNVVIKIPVCTSLNGKSKFFDGIKAIRAITQARIPVNATLIFTPEQALLAAKAGASYVSPFIGRLDDYIRTQHGIGFEKNDYYPADGTRKGDAHLGEKGLVSGVDLLAKCVTIFKNYNLKTQIIASSVRNARQFREAALCGAHIATIPPELLQELVMHNKTVEGLKQFVQDVSSDYSKLGVEKR
jgi:transaldolase